MHTREQLPFASSKLSEVPAGRGLEGDQLVSLIMRELYGPVMFLGAVHNLVGYPLILRLSTCFFKRVACFLGFPNNL
uniref:Uncharacterized protein n=1 Tax=Hyaloperonospora arabidopsidis (strain Emoy2) TaxID=559515 RepID=M4BYU0_HYAAE